MIGSDLDVAAVVAEREEVNEVHEPLAQLARRTYSLYGLRISTLVLDLEKLGTMHADGDALIETLLRDDRRIPGQRLEGSESMVTRANRKEVDPSLAERCRRVRAGEEMYDRRPPNRRG